LLYTKTLIEELNTKTSTIINAKTLVYNLKASKPLLEVETKSLMMNETIKANERLEMITFNSNNCILDIVAIAP